MIWPNILLAAVGSYLIGSFSPGFFLGWLVKGIDIRDFGNRNTGATNVYRLVGPFFGILTATADVAKGVATFLLSRYLVGFPDLALVVSLLAIVGHNYPFYLGFRGGKGVATSWGLILTSLFFTRSIIALLVLILLFVRTVWVSPRLKFIKPARKIYRLSAFLFLISYWYFGQTYALAFILTATGAFFILDILRFFIPKINIFIFQKLGMILKPKEKKFFSTTTLFLIGVALVIYYFPAKIVFTAVTFALIGDMVAEIFGTTFGKLRLGRKSLEGSLFGAAACFLAGLFLMAPLDINLFFILKGAIFATLIEFVSQKVDDNLTIPLGTAFLLKIFS